MENEAIVDVFKIKRGDTIKFRNGDIHTVTEVEVREEIPGLGPRSVTISIEQDDEEYCFTYEDSGGIYYASGNSNKAPNRWDIVEHIPNQKDEEPAQDEMTMRDQFAMAAISGLALKSYSCYEDLARWSYDIADEMMKARKKNN